MWRWLSWGDFLACKYLYLSWFISKKHFLLLNQYLQQVGTLVLSPIMLPEPLLHVDNQQQQAPGPQFQQPSNHKIQFDVFWSILDKQYRKNTKKMFAFVLLNLLKSTSFDQYIKVCFFCYCRCYWWGQLPVGENFDKNKFYKENAVNTFLWRWLSWGNFLACKYFSLC